MRTLVIALIVYELFLKPKPPRGDVDIGDAIIGSSPDEWARYPRSRP